MRESRQSGAKHSMVAGVILERAALHMKLRTIAGFNTDAGPQLTFEVTLLMYLFTADLWSRGWGSRV